MVDHQLVHHHEHDHGRGQVVEIGAQAEAAQGKHGDGDPRLLRATQLRHKVEAAVVGKNINYRHRSQQVHDDADELNHVSGKDVLTDVLVHSLQAVALSGQEFLKAGIMESLDVIWSHTDIQDPSPYAAEESDGGFVDARDVFCADEHIAEQH